MAPELGLPSLVGVDVAVDGFLTDPLRRAFIAHPAGYLFGRPTADEAVFDALAVLGLAQELAPPGPAAIGLALRD